MIVVVGVEGFGVAAVGVNAAPSAFEYPGAEQILHQFRYIVAITFLPAVGNPSFGINFHREI